MPEKIFTGKFFTLYYILIVVYCLIILVKNYNNLTNTY